MLSLLDKPLRPPQETFLMFWLINEKMYLKKINRRLGVGERDFWRFNFLVCFERIFTQKQQHVCDVLRQHW